MVLNEFAKDHAVMLPAVYKKTRRIPDYARNVMLGFVIRRPPRLAASLSVPPDVIKKGVQNCKRKSSGKINS